MRWLVMLFAVGCAGDAGHPEEFDFNVTAHWTTTEHPEVTSLTIDGENIADGRTWTFDDGETSYVDASDSFVRGATVTTASGQKTSLIKLASCNHLDQVTLKSLGHLIGEEDVYAIDSTDALAWSSGRCIGVDGAASVTATLRARTR